MLFEGICGWGDWSSWRRGGSENLLKRVPEFSLQHALLHYYREGRGLYPYHPFSGYESSIFPGLGNFPSCGVFRCSICGCAVPSICGCRGLCPNNRKQPILLLRIPFNRSEEGLDLHFSRIGFLWVGAGDYHLRSWVVPEAVQELEHFGGVFVGVFGVGHSGGPFVVGGRNWYYVGFAGMRQTVF